MSFSNVSRIEAGLETVTGESRERIADTVPGKYQLAESDDRNRPPSSILFLAPFLFLLLSISHFSFRQNSWKSKSPFLRSTVL